LNKKSFSQNVIIRSSPNHNGETDHQIANPKDPAGYYHKRDRIINDAQKNATNPKSLRHFGKGIWQRYYISKIILIEKIEAELKDKSNQKRSGRVGQLIEKEETRTQHDQVNDQ
jgi:hypothetical protein